MANSSNLLQDLLELLAALDGMSQRELGWLYSSSRYAVTYSDPQVRVETQTRLDHCVGGLSVVYLFAMFEECVPYTDWSKYVWPDYERVLAFRHIRHSVAHGFDGRRAKTHSKNFDIIMSSLHPIEAIASWSCSHLSLNSSAGLQLQEVLIAATKRIIGQVASAA